VVLEGGNDAEDARLFTNLALACLEISAAESLGFELDKAFEQQEGQERLLDSLRSWHRTRTIDVSLERGLHPLLDSWVGGTDDEPDVRVAEGCLSQENGVRNTNVSLGLA
jgi:hypothetical protein